MSGSTCFWVVILPWAVICYIAVGIDCAWIMYGRDLRGKFSVPQRVGQLLCVIGWPFLAIAGLFRLLLMSFLFDGDHRQE